MIRTLLKGAAVFLVLGSLLSGCTVKFNQLEMLTSSFSKKPDGLAPYRWRATLGDYTAEVLAVEIPGGTLFVNNNDDLIRFDGWLITAVNGLGVSSRELVIEGETGKKRLSDGSRKLGMHQCGQWRQVMSGVGFTHEQDCQGETIYKNSIKINAAGSIVSIVQYLQSEAMFIRLEKQ